MIHRGDIYWVEPVADSPSAIRHPHVVVQDDVLNQSRVETVVVCALTSNLQRAKDPGNVLLEAGEANLERQSVVVVSKVSTLPKARLSERIGNLSSERVEQILAGMRFLQTSFFRDR